MTDLSQRDRACLRAREARAELLDAIYGEVPTEGAQRLLRDRVEALYSAVLLVCTMGEEPVSLTMQSKLKREGP